jgi:TPR repeat protein
MYDEDQGIPKNDTQAFIWYRKTADQGHVAAQFNLGVMYSNGQGVPKNAAQAIIWFRKAADLGFSRAQFNPGLMYENDLWVPQDKVIAYSLFNLAADLNLSDAIQGRKIIESTMSRRSIDAGQELTLKIAQSGNLLKTLDRYSENIK